MKRLKLITALGEVVIPLFGLLFLDWGLYFILLFYFIDLLASEVFSYIKVNRIIRFQTINFAFNLRYGRLIINSLLVILIILIAHIAVYFIAPEIDFISEFIAFLKYEEKGVPIAQGYILLPIVILGNYQEYRMTFIKMGEYRMRSWKELIFTRRKALFVAIIGGLLSIGVAYFVTLPEYVYIVAIIGVKFYLDYREIQKH